VAWIVGDPAEWIAERSHGLLEGDLVLGAIGRRLPRIPLEHLFSIYGTSRTSSGRAEGWRGPD
jgi:hypothetical protein